MCKAEGSQQRADLTGGSNLRCTRSVINEFVHEGRRVQLEHLRNSFKARPRLLQMENNSRRTPALQRLAREPNLCQHNQ